MTRRLTHFTAALLTAATAMLAFPPATTSEAQKAPTTIEAVRK